MTDLKTRLAEILEDALTEAYNHGELKNRNGVVQKTLDQALAQILDELRKTLPPKLKIDMSERDAQMNRGWNAYHDEFLKRMEE